MTPEQSAGDRLDRLRGRKELGAVIFGEPEASKFLEALRRMKLQKVRREQLARQAKLKARVAVRKTRG